MGFYWQHLFFNRGSSSIDNMTMGYNRKQKPNASLKAQIIGLLCFTLWRESHIHRHWKGSCITIFLICFSPIGGYSFEVLNLTNKEILVIIWGHPRPPCWSLNFPWGKHPDVLNSVPYSTPSSCCTAIDSLQKYLGFPKFMASNFPCILALPGKSYCQFVNCNKFFIYRNTFFKISKNS